MRNQDGAGEVFKHLPPEKFVTKFNRRVYERIMGRMREEKPVSLADFEEDFTPDEISYLAGIQARYDGVPVSRQDAHEYINVLLQENKKRELGSAAEAPPGEIENYLEELRQQKK